MKLTKSKLVASATSLALAFGLSALAPQTAQATPPPSFSLACNHGDYISQTLSNGDLICYNTVWESFNPVSSTTFTVPNYGTSVKFVVTGAMGEANSGVSGGKGAVVTAIRDAAPGDSYTITTAAGGFGGSPQRCAWAGHPALTNSNSGGAAGIVTLNSDSTVQIIAAGGGGPGCGDGGAYTGGTGGNASLPAVSGGASAIAATAGGSFSSYSTGGAGATSSAGGAGGTGDICNGGSGGYLTAGAVGCDTVTPGGGGGAGYYGGGAGGARGGGGGGGYSHVSGFTVTAASFNTTAGWDQAHVSYYYTLVAPRPSVPQAPVATAGVASASVTVVPAGSGPAATSYSVIASPGGQTCTVNPTISLTCNVTGLTNGISYSFTSVAINSFGNTTPSAASGSVTPRPAQTNQASAFMVGTPRVGQMVAAGSTNWDAGVSLSFQWYLDGTLLVGATNAGYTVTRSSLSGNLWCRVTGQKYGYLDQSVDTDPSQVLSDLPTFSGSLQVDQTLTADAGYWPDDASLTYQWRANGSDIAGATELTFTLRPSDVGKRITFAVTGVRTGFATKTKVAANTSPVALAQQVNTPVPTVSGTFRVGQTLTATVGSWDYGVSLSYRWLRNGSPIPGESGTSYTLGMADNGKQIAFKLTSTKSGYVSVVRYSVNTSVSYLQHQVITSTPVITGSPVYGETLTVNVGSWDIDASVDWIWTRNGVPVPDTARQTTYQIGLQDLGKRITVKLIATEAGYFDESRVSNSTALIGPRRFSQVGVPVVSGIAAVGETLTVDPGTWDQAANLTIEWCRNGQPIPGATQTTYVLTSQDAKTRVTARVTASAVAYITVVAGSGKSGAVSR